MRPALPLALAAATLLGPAAAAASPWTLPRGQFALAAGYSFQTATREFFETGSARNFPLQGRYTGSTFTLGFRAGLTDALELEVQLPIRTVNYASDPVIPLARPMGDTSGLSDFEYYRRNVVNLSRTATGLADLVFATRYRLPVRSSAVALELRVKIPSGYAGPSGTFGDNPRSAQEFLANAYQYVSPRNVQDDVTLGDGQVDITPSILLGHAFATRTFVRFDAGYNLRLGGAGHQVLSALRAGQSLGDRLLVYAWLQAAITVTEGRILGISVAAIDPDVPAERYSVDNLLLRELRFERDIVDVGAGIILRLTPTTELNAGYQRTLWGRNTSVIDGFNLSFAMRASLLPGT